MTSTAPMRMEYDPFSPAFQADPFPVYRWMRDEAPVFYSEKWNWWALSRFEDVRAAATDHATFLSFEGIDIDATATDQSGPGFLPDEQQWNPVPTADADVSVVGQRGYASGLRLSPGLR